MTNSERVRDIVTELLGIESFDNVMRRAEICNADTINADLRHGELLAELHVLDADAYELYMIGDEETLRKYYSFTAK